MQKIRDNLLEIQLKERKSNRNLLIWVLVIILAMTMLLVMNTYVFLNIQVLESSMEPTLYDGDILVTNVLRKPDYGDIIIIKDVENYWLIKRVVGLGGDTVEIKDGYVYRNGTKLEEEYLVELTDAKGWTKRTLAENEIFYLGDNRDVSKDSRSLGPCTTDNVVGVVEEWSVKLKGIRTFLHNIPVRIGEFLGVKGCSQSGRTHE